VRVVSRNCLPYCDKIFVKDMDRIEGEHPASSNRADRVQALEALLPQVRKPGRYGGNECNVIRKQWSTAKVRVALIFPDLYEIGMSHQGLQILYQCVNREEGFLAERAYVPDTDLEEMLRSRNLPLFSLESKRPLADFDVLGISLPYELCYSNILTILDLAGLPFRSEQRGEDQALIIGGGPCAFHAEPVADFFDAILLGDGEEAIVEILRVVREGKAASWPRGQVLERLAELEGVYVPRFFKPQYVGQGRLTAIVPQLESRPKVRRRVLPALPPSSNAIKPLVPLTQIVHDRLGLEIARGCTRGCRFCQAGMIYRPVRERDPLDIMEMAEQGIAGGGFEELALLSLSTGDYSCLGPLLGQLMDRFAGEKVAVSMPSMRVGTLTPEVMEQIRRVRKTGFTLAPEAGSERLRLAINKGITEEDLLATCKSAATLGWRQIKLYFMFGLPTETDEDIEAIVELANKASASCGRGCTIAVSAATFVPKPHTPFQMARQLSIDEGFARIDFLKKALRQKWFKLKWHDPRQSYLEGVFSRGDRRLADVIETAWRKGARLDAWSDYFELERWRQAAAACGIDLEDYLRAREPEEVLPWQHLDVGVDDAFMQKEMENALSGLYTPDCRVHGCQKCGLCDFKKVRPVIAELPDTWRRDGVSRQAGEKTADEPGCEAQYRYRIDFQKKGPARLLSHLEMMRIFFRAFRRLRLPLHFSKGFHPTPKVSFGPALSLGVESRAEFLTMVLHAPLTDPGVLQAKLNDQLPEGLAVMAIVAGPFKIPDVLGVRFRLTLPKPVQVGKIQDFLGSASMPMTVKRKKKAKIVDVRPLVTDLCLISERLVEVELKTAVSQPGVKAQELAAWLCELQEEQGEGIRVEKLGWRELFP